MARFAETKGLSKQEKFMIQGMIITNNSIEEIAKYLEREIELINSFVETIQAETPQTIDTQEIVVAQPQTQHIINKTGRGQSGVAIMTPAGSERADANKNGKDIHTAKSSHYTHKIK